MAAYYSYSQMVPLCLCGHMSMKSELLSGWTQFLAVEKLYPSLFTDL